MKLYNKNSVNGHSEDMSMLPLEKQISGVLEGKHYQIFHCHIIKLYIIIFFFFLSCSVDCDQSTEDNNLVAIPDDMCVVASGSGSGDQSEDSSITDSER